MARIALMTGEIPPLSPHSLVSTLHSSAVVEVRSRFFGHVYLGGLRALQQRASVLINWLYSTPAAIVAPLRCGPHPWPVGRRRPCVPVCGRHLTLTRRR